MMRASSDKPFPVNREEIVRRNIVAIMANEKLKKIAQESVKGTA